MRSRYCFRREQSSAPRLLLPEQGIASRHSSARGIATALPAPRADAKAITRLVPRRDNRRDRDVAEALVLGDAPDEGARPEQPTRRPHRGPLARRRIARPTTCARSWLMIAGVAALGVHARATCSRPAATDMPSEMGPKILLACSAGFR